MRKLLFVFPFLLLQACGGGGGGGSNSGADGSPSSGSGAETDPGTDPGTGPELDAVTNLTDTFVDVEGVNGKLYVYKYSENNDTSYVALIPKTTQLRVGATVRIDAGTLKNRSEVGVGGNINAILLPGKNTNGVDLAVDDATLNEISERSGVLVDNIYTYGLLGTVRPRANNFDSPNFNYVYNGTTKIVRFGADNISLVDPDADTIELPFPDPEGNMTFGYGQENTPYFNVTVGLQNSERRTFTTVENVKIYLEGKLQMNPAQTSNFEVVVND